jgi:7-cyano-7-deazaguanine synthase
VNDAQNLRLNRISEHPASSDLHAPARKRAILAAVRAGPQATDDQTYHPSRAIRSSMPTPDPTLRPAIVLLSGGLDSATALAVARRDGFACHTLAFDYGQRHRHELAAAVRVSRALGAIDHRVVSIDLRAIGGSALTADIDVPKDRSAATLSAAIPITYVPARNLIFLSIATGFAEVAGARDIFIGVNAIDYSGYPDCRPEFIATFEHAANLGTRAGVESRREDQLRIQSPLARLTKADIILLGASLVVDYSLTHSCYDPIRAEERKLPVQTTGANADTAISHPDPQFLACGRCDSCVLRRAGFQAAGIPDPTNYA